MANITFSSVLHKDKTVYAVAGSHKKTILEIAKENHIPIDFCCGDGECGTCLVKVFSVNRKKRMGHPLTKLFPCRKNFSHAGLFPLRTACR